MQKIRFSYFLSNLKSKRKTHFSWPPNKIFTNVYFSLGGQEKFMFLYCFEIAGPQKSNFHHSNVIFPCFQNYRKPGKSPDCTIKNSQINSFMLTKVFMAPLLCKKCETKCDIENVLFFLTLKHKNYKTPKKCFADKIIWCTS